MSGIGWPDIAIGFVVVFGALKGFKRGFVNELAGAVAIVFALVAAFAYTGAWDSFVHDRTHVGPGSAHVVGMVAYAAAAYFVVLALGAALSAVARLPLIGTANALLGALVGILKAAIFMWAILYVALFFPLSHDVRDELHRSRFVAILQQPNAGLDETVRASLPPFVRPFAGSMFSRHRV